MRIPRIVSATCLATALVATVPTPSASEDPISASLNYAFATQLGSGIYRVNGRTVQLYRLSVTVPIRGPEDGDWVVRLKLPLTFGFYNFKLQDVIDSPLPEKLAVLALVPTLDVEYRAREQWWIGPFGGIGVGKDFEGGEVSTIFALGGRSLAIWPKRGFDIRLGNRLVYSGYTTKDLDFIDDFGMFETGIDFRRALGFDIGRHELDGSLFGANYLYFVSPQLVLGLPGSIEMRTGWEVGFTVGTVDTWRVLGIGLPRLGLSYRFGSGSDAVRFIIGDAFPIDRPTDTGTAVQ